MVSYYDFPRLSFLCVFYARYVSHEREIQLQESECHGMSEMDRGRSARYGYIVKETGVYYQFHRTYGRHQVGFSACLYYPLQEESCD